jgi:hypothetical protein
MFSKRFVQSTQPFFVLEHRRDPSTASPHQWHMGCRAVLAAVMPIASGSTIPARECIDSPTFYSH